MNPFVSPGPLITSPGMYPVGTAAAGAILQDFTSPFFGFASPAAFFETVAPEVVVAADADIFRNSIGFTASSSFL